MVNFVCAPIVGINLPKPQRLEPSQDLIQTSALLTNLQTQVFHSHCYLDAKFQAKYGVSREGVQKRLAE